MVLCGGQYEPQKVALDAAVAGALYTTRIVAASRDHRGTCGMEEKIMVMRGMMVVSRAGSNDAVERERSSTVLGKRERERSTVIVTIYYNAC